MVYAAALRMPSRHESGPGRTAHGVSVRLGKTNSRLGKFVDSRSQQVVRSVATGIEGALIIGEENDFGLAERKDAMHPERNRRTKNLIGFGSGPFEIGRLRGPWSFS